jgi:hypothetical protein
VITPQDFEFADLLGLAPVEVVEEGGGGKVLVKQSSRAGSRRSWRWR